MVGRDAARSQWMNAIIGPRSRPDTTTATTRDSSLSRPARVCRGPCLTIRTRWVSGRHIGGVILWPVQESLTVCRLYGRRDGASSPSWRARATASVRV